MAWIRKFPKEIVVARVFRPGRLRHQSLAAAYEQLVPLGRRFGRQELPRSDQERQEVYRWA